LVPKLQKLSESADALRSWLYAAAAKGDTMARTENDTWDISAESVGSTALGAAGSRAKESAGEDPLISDPFAQLFVDVAAARGLMPALYSDEILSRLEAIDPLLVRQLMAQSVYVASRTKWFDEFFGAAQADDVHQAVILGAGLDARAWRLPWTDGSVVFEIDQPKVLDFKGQVLSAHHAEAMCRYVPIGADLRHDWPKALCDAGFDPTRPTAWSAEGLLVYLPAAGQHLLFDRIQALSARRSRIAVDVTGARFFDPETLGRLSAWFTHLLEMYARIGAEVADTPGLWFDEDRADVSAWLRDHGWTVESVDILDLMTRYQRGVPEEEAAGIPACDCISAQLT
jgi:methyltransferase (TIGR00027 family)